MAEIKIIRYIWFNPSRNKGKKKAIKIIADPRSGWNEIKKTGIAKSAMIFNWEESFLISVCILLR